MATKGARVHIYGDWDGSAVKKATKDLTAFEKQTRGFSSGITKSFAGIGASIGGALAFGAIAAQLRDMAMAAAEDQQSVVALSRALANVGLGAATQEAEAFVEQLMLATGVADTDLRKALQTLTTATGDFAQSQQLLRVAMDVSAATGRDLTSVSLALAKASQGNISALTRLGVPLDANIVKSKDFDAAIASISDRFDGQAAAAADTYAGKMRILAATVDEVRESIGYGLLQSGDEVIRVWGGTGGVTETLSNWADNFALGLAGLAAGYGDFIDELTLGVINLQDKLGILGDEEADLMRGVIESEKAQRAQRLEMMATGQAAAAAGADISGYSEDIAGTTRQAAKATTALQRLQAQMDKMQRNRSIASQRIGLAEMRQEGPGKGASRRDVRKFGLDYAGQAESLASDIAERGGFSEQSKRRARRVLVNARDYLGSLGLGGNFTDAGGAFLATPGELRSGTRQQRVVAEQTGARSTTINYNFGGDIVVQRTEQAIEEAKRLARLAAAGRGPVAPVRAVG